MCGIVGYTSAGSVDGSLIDRMTDALRHRGPDGRGVHRAEDVALGHRRLSIQDLSENGAQPMLSRDGSVAIVYNGECYNNADLRRALGDVPWRSTSDTETLLECYQRYGAEFIRRVNGMFAIAILDLRARVIHLYRDRMGEKPLFYSVRNGALVFASELKAMLLHPHVPRDLSKRALRDYLLFNYVAGNRSIIRGVKKIPPAGMLTFALDTGEVKRGSFWSLPAPVPDQSYKTIDDATDALEELLLDAVDRRRVADVPLGCFLSGGIDSSTIAWALTRAAGEKVRTFTIGFRESGYDESPHAAAVAKYLGTEHHCEMMSENDALALIPGLPGLCDEPFADASLLPTALLCRMTRNHVTVALSGDGGDELFLGYDRYRWADKVRRAMRFVPFGVRYNLADHLAAGLPYRQRMIAWGMRYGNESSIYPYVFAGWSEVLASSILSKKNVFHEHDMVTRSDKLTRRHGFLPAMGTLDLSHYLPDDILVKVDRAAMASSLETRVPLLDHRLVTFAQRLPVEWRMKGNDQKILLRRLLYRHVPRRLLERPKAGFAVPLKTWFRGKLKDLLLAELSSQRLGVHGHFDPQAVRSILQEHLSGRANYERTLWALLVFQLWHREYLE